MRVIPKSRPELETVSDEEILAAAFRAAGNSWVGEVVYADVRRELGGRLSKNRLGDRKRRLEQEGRWLWDPPENGPKFTEEQLARRIAKVKAESLARHRLACSGPGRPRLSGDGSPRRARIRSIRVATRSGRTD